jgi:hypothetical protein
MARDREGVEVVVVLDLDTYFVVCCAPDFMPVSVVLLVVA